MSDPYAEVVQASFELVTLSDGTNVPAVITVDCKRLSPRDVTSIEVATRETESRYSGTLALVDPQPGLQTTTAEQHNTN